ncbi:MAG TPA: MFS transporter, partial [Pseudolabrys sp.]|nr:MFS transporter [Pseudolabrys sp.]
PSAWSPLRQPIFRALWLASVASNIGTWMQNVGAAWLMTSLAPTPAMVALVQAATSLPVFLVGLPAGAVADLVDRRRLLLATQGWMLAAASLLGLLTFMHAITPWSLLILTFALGLGAAMNAPAWQAILPELVGNDDLKAAVTLNGVGFNVARAVGPALGGLIVAALGSGAVFLLNACSFLGVMFVLYRWPRTASVSTLPAEDVFGAMRAGVRYVRHAPAVQAVLLRTGAFIFGGSALWALLPLVARDELGLGATGYGVILGCLGAGAVAGGLFLPRIERRFSTDALLAGAVVLFALVTAAPVYAAQFALLSVLMIIGGLAWITIMSTFNVAAQTTVPAWVRARALAVYGIVAQGGMAVGSAFWGLVAEHVPLSMTLLLAGTALMLSIAAALRYRLRIDEAIDLTPSEHWPAPVLSMQPAPDAGPVLITVEYIIDAARADEFLRVMRAVRTLRLRDGAYRWGLYSDSSAPTRFVEAFVVESWAEHLRQHSRVTVADKDVWQIALAFHVGPTPPSVSHLIYAGNRR